MGRYLPMTVALSPGKNLVFNDYIWLQSEKLKKG